VSARGAGIGCRLGIPMRHFPRLAGCAFALVAGACGAASSPMTFEDRILVGDETTEQTTCIVMYADAGAAKVDACRARVRAAWDRQWAATFDGGGAK
jgi:hypothetical protein